MAIVAFLVALVAAAVMTSLPGAAEETPPDARGSAPTDAASGSVPEEDDLVTATAPARRAIGGLSSGRALREEAAEAAAAEQEAAADAAAAEAAAATTTTAPPTTAAPATAPPTTAPPTTTPPTTAPPPPPTTAAPVPAASSGVWDAIAACESGGRWDLNTGNGYFGGLQFLQSTWELSGGLSFAPAPHLASRDAQIAVAERVVAASGGSYRAWGGCAARLGLP